MRDCGTSVYGDLGGSAFLPASVVAGPLAFVQARGYARSTSSFAGIGGGRYRPMKLLTVVRTGWVARVVVPAAHRENVSLAYDRERSNTPIAPGEGVHEVTFASCPPGRPFLGPSAERWTQFNGSIVVAGRRCVTLAVYAAKQGHELPSLPQVARLSFGAGGRCAT